MTQQTRPRCGLPFAFEKNLLCNKFQHRLKVAEKEGNANVAQEWTSIRTPGTAEFAEFTNDKLGGLEAVAETGETSRVAESGEEAEQGICLSYRRATLGGGKEEIKVEGGSTCK